MFSRDFNRDTTSQQAVNAQPLIDSDGIFENRSLTWTVVGNNVSWAILFIVVCLLRLNRYVFLFWIISLIECKLDYKNLIMTGTLGYPVDVELLSCFILDFFMI